MLIPISAAQLERVLGPAPAAPRLVKAAHEFEAQLMKELLKPLTSGDEDAEGSEGASGALGDYAGEALGNAISARGGFGIANQLITQLSHSGNGTEPVTTTRNASAGRLMNDRE